MDPGHVVGLRCAILSFLAVPVIIENLVRTHDHPLPEKPIEGTLKSEARCPESQSGECKKAFVAPKNLALARERRIRKRNHDRPHPRQPPDLQPSTHRH